MQYFYRWRTLGGSLWAQGIGSVHCHSRTARVAWASMASVAHFSDHNHCVSLLRAPASAAAMTRQVRARGGCNWRLATPMSHRRNQNSTCFGVRRSRTRLGSCAHLDPTPSNLQVKGTTIQPVESLVTSSGTMNVSKASLTFPVMHEPPGIQQPRVSMRMCLHSIVLPR